jgi:1-acyl-sn-glycerol-3-phosphate acyltransferase
MSHLGPDLYLYSSFYNTLHILYTMNSSQIKPIIKLTRPLVKQLIALALTFTSKVEITGRQNIPANEPLLLTANHFSHVDPLLLIHTSPRNLEFWGGTNLPHVPPLLRTLPQLWGFYPVNRGGVSRDAVIAARNVLNNGGVFGVFPEAGAWATVLRPARQGAALLAAQTGVRIVPIGISGADEILHNIKKPLYRPPVNVQIGPPIGPFPIGGKDRISREDLESISEQIMRAIAVLLPPDRRGVYSDDPALRKAAQEVAQYPWENNRELEITNRTTWTR